MDTEAYLSYVLDQLRCGCAAMCVCGGDTMKRLAIAAAFAVASMGAANAATFDFAGLADAPPGPGSNEGSWESRPDLVVPGLGVFVDATDTFTNGGIGVVATGGSYDSTVASPVDLGDTSAYLDKTCCGGPAGLGAAKTSFLTGGNQANPGNDDNTGISGGTSAPNANIFEFIVLTFTEAVFLDQVSFVDDDHNALTSGKIGYNKTGTAIFADLAIGGAVNDYSALGASTVWTFAKITGGENFYVKSITATPVPLPAPALMLLAGLGGLAAMKRRSKSA